MHSSEQSKGTFNTATSQTNLALRAPRPTSWEREPNKHKKINKTTENKKRKKPPLANGSHYINTKFLYTVGAIIIWSLADFVGLPTYKEWNCVYFSSYVHFNTERQNIKKKSRITTSYEFYTLIIIFLHEISIWSPTNQQ